MIALPFANRAQAARLLADRLAGHAGHVAVLARPAALPMGRIVADRLRCPLDAVLVRALQPPGCAPPGAGTLDETGEVRLSDCTGRSRIGDRELEADIHRQRNALDEQRLLLRGDDGAPLELRGRTAVVVDDGIATGATMRAAVGAARARRPDRVICAVPVADSAGLGRIEGLCDAVVCLATPLDFTSVDRYCLDGRRPPATAQRAAMRGLPASADAQRTGVAP